MIPLVYRVLAVYDDEVEAGWLDKWKPTDISESPDRMIIRIKCEEKIGLTVPSLLKPRPVDKLRKQAPKLVQHINEILNKTAKETNEPLHPIIFVGLGFAAVIVMEAILQQVKKLELAPMGVIVGSVDEKSPTAESPEFKRWYAEFVEQENGAKERRRIMEEKLAEQEDVTKEERERMEKEVTEHEKEDFKDLTDVLQKFNKYCQQEHIRFSYVFRHSEASDGFASLIAVQIMVTLHECRADWQKHDFFSKYLRYGQPYVEKKEFPMEKILNNHITRSWPEILVELVKNGHDKESQMLIEHYLGQHCHEPMITRALHEAAFRGKTDIIRFLLKDGIHPDVCLKHGERTAFDKSADKANCPDSERLKVRELLYEYGAKVHGAPSPPCSFWCGFDCHVEHEPQPPIPEKFNNETKTEEFRGLIVEIFSPEPNTNITSSSQDKNEDKGREGSQNGPSKLPVQEDSLERNDKASNQEAKDKGRNYEIHRIEYPTVQDLIEKGPDAIMGERPSSSKAEIRYDRYRWIHLPMNHMGWLREIVKRICKEDCGNTDRHKMNDEADPEQMANFSHRRSSSENCTEECFKKWADRHLEGDDGRFPCVPGCADSIFEARYWLGQQVTFGTDEYSAIRSLRPQFHRLGIANGKRTGFAVMLPYIHFDTYENVKNMKEEVALVKQKTREQILTPSCHAEVNDDTDFPTTINDVIAKDLYSYLPIHCRRTLSQYFYHSRLQSPKQVITSHFEEKWYGEVPLTLMVDQLWMLVLTDGTILTCFPSQMGGIQREFPYVYTDIVEELLSHLRSKWRSPITTQLDLGFMIIKECMGFLFNQRARYNKRFRFLNIYEQQLSDIAADEVQTFEKLKKIVELLPDPKSPRYEAQAKLCLERLLSLDKEMKIMKKLENLKHIRRELNIIMEVLTQQKLVVEQMTEDLQDVELWHFKDSEDLMAKRVRRGVKLDRRRNLILSLDKRAECIFNDIELSTRRKEQQVRNLQAFFSSSLFGRSVWSGNIILVFTVVTTVFAPLSFLTAFFTLQIREFPHNGDSIQMTLSYVSRWIFGVGFSIIVGFITLVVLFVLSVEEIRALTRARTNKKDAALKVGQRKTTFADQATQAIKNFLARCLAKLRRRRNGDVESKIPDSDE